MLLVICAALPVRAAEGPAKATPSATPAVPAVDPGAVSAVDRMGDYLKTLRAFAVHAETTTDEILLGGAKIQYQGSFDLTVRWPDRMRVSFERDGRNPQEFFYDGTSVTVWIKARNMWASVPAPGTIPALIEMMHAKYGMPMPLEDLLLDAAKKQILERVTAGVVIGPSRVAGVECEHYGFHQKDVDWQIWIPKGDSPLPRKFLVTTLGEPTQPQHSEVLTWDLSPKLDDAMFTFVPPAGAEKIVFAEAPRPPGGKRTVTPATPQASTAKKEGSP